MCSVCLPAAAKGSTSASCLFSGYLKVVFHPQDPSSPPLSWLQLVAVGCGTVPSFGCLVVLCTQGVCWQLWTQLPTGYHLAPRMGDLYPMGFPKGQPTCGGSLHPPGPLLSLSCQDGIVLKEAGQTLRIWIYESYQIIFCPLENCCVGPRVSPSFLILLTKVSLSEGSMVTTSKLLS